MSHKPTVSELAVLMGRTFNAAQSAAASPLIDLAEMRAVHILNRPLHAGTVTDEEHVLVAGQEHVFFKNYPVTDVTALSITAPDYSVTTTLDPDDYPRYIWGLAGFRNSAEGELVLVSYTHDGLDEHQELMVYGVIMSAASRWMSRVLADAFGLHAMSTEGTSYTWEKDGDSITFTKQENRALDRVRRRGGVG